MRQLTVDTTVGAIHELPLQQYTVRGRLVPALIMFYALNRYYFIIPILP
ncbi:hypothetical protein KKE26_03405 [bacterium]|nr:hypothetical protein [bacterium]